MPAAKGKQSISVVVPEEVKDALDVEAAARGMDRSSLILEKLDTGHKQGTWARVSIRLDRQDRGITALHEQVEQLAISLRELVEALQKAPATPLKKVYPTPATWAETYPELYAPKVEEPAPIVAVSPAEQKGWRPWRR